MKNIFNYIYLIKMLTILIWTVVILHSHICSNYPIKENTYTKKNFSLLPFSEQLGTQSFTVDPSLIYFWNKKDTHFITFAAVCKIHVHTKGNEVNKAPGSGITNIRGKIWMWLWNKMFWFFLFVRCIINSFC